MAIMVGGYLKGRHESNQAIERMKRVGPSAGMPVPPDKHPDDKFGESSLQRVADELETSHRAELRRRDRRIAMLEGSLATKAANEALQAARIAELEEALASALSGYSLPAQELPEQQKTPLVLELDLVDVTEEDDRRTARPPK